MERDLNDRIDLERLSREERECLDRFRDGEREAFHTLMRPHFGALHSLAQRLAGDPDAADDLTQETLVRAFRGLAGFGARSTLRTWLFRILTRLASEPDRWRKRDRASALDGIDVPDELPGPDEPAMMRELRDRIEEALERLTTKQRAAFHLRAVEGLDYRAIAAALGTSAAAARMLVLEARRKVMARVGRYLEP